MISTRGTDMEIKESWVGGGAGGGESDKNLDGMWRAWEPPWKGGVCSPWAVQKVFIG